MKLKLPKITSSDPIERLSVGLKQSTHNLLRQYQVAYAEAYGEEIPTSTLIDDILRRFILEDKAFAKALSGQSKAPKQQSVESAQDVQQSAFGSSE